MLFFMCVSFVMCFVSSVTWFRCGARVCVHLCAWQRASLIARVCHVDGSRSPKQPPLPDIIHDLIPEVGTHAQALSLRCALTLHAHGCVTYVSQLTYTPIPLLGGITFDAVPDAAIGVLLSATLVFIFTNQHRWFIVRRFFVIYAALMALRSVCIVATSLPDPHPHCRNATPGNTPFSDMELRFVFTVFARSHC